MTIKVIGVFILAIAVLLFHLADVVNKTVTSRLRQVILRILIPTVVILGLVGLLIAAT